MKMPYAGLPSQLEAPMLKPKKLKIKFGGALFVNNGAVLAAGRLHKLRLPSQLPSVRVSAPACTSNTPFLP